jgi:hypothetical protein
MVTYILEANDDNLECGPGALYKKEVVLLKVSFSA